MARQERKYHYIYKITCKITNRYYIGMHSTDNLNDGYFGSGKRLWFSINYHGKDNHIKEILEWLPTREALKNREKELVTKELIDENLCMNLCVGGEGGATRIGVKTSEITKNKIRKKLLGHFVSEETKKKISIKGKGLKKKPLSDETKIKMSIAKKGLPSKLKNVSRTEETKKKISESNKSNSFFSLPRKPHLEETKKKISESNKGKLNKKVIQLTKVGDVLKIWESITLAEKTLKISHITHVCNGSRKSSGGYIWKYF